MKDFASDDQRETADTGADEEVAFYERSIPDIAEIELEKLYSSVMTTLARFSIYNAAPDASTYVVRRRGAVHSVILFKRERSHVIVYNEQIRLEQTDIKNFVKRIFSRYPSVSRVSFYAIDSETDAIPYAFMKFECLEDIVLPLPETESEYFSSLEKHTRASIKRRHKRILRDFPSFRFDVVNKNSITSEQIEKLVGFSQARMLAKGEKCYHTEQSTEKLTQLVRKYGAVCLAVIDGQVCGGVIGHRLGTHHFAHLASHDPGMDEYGLGILCNYLGICIAISDGIKFLHFGWGRSDYKYRLLGKNKELFRLDVYRNHLSKLAHINHISGVLWITRIRHLKLWLSAIEHGGSPSNKRVIKFIGFLRKIRRKFKLAD